MRPNIFDDPVVDGEDDGAIIIRHDARSLPLEDESVDLVVTSPPYFALRSYRDDGKHFDGQIGSEDTPDEWLDNLDDCMVEWGRVLKPSGSVWINLGDKYANAPPSGTAVGGKQRGHHATCPNCSKASGRWVFCERHAASKADVPDINLRKFAREKSLMGLPWRFAIRQIDAGWILRAEVVWCLSGGVRLYVRIDGKPRVVMLRDLYRAYQPESVELWNGEKWTQVLGWNETPRPDNPIEFRLRSGEWITSTANHLWPRNDGFLLRADAIQVGDVIQTTRLPDEPYLPNGLHSDDTGWLVGMYLAEGSRSEGVIQFAGHINEADRHARLCRIARDFHGTGNVYQTGENTATCNLSGSVVNGIIDRYVTGRNAKTKHLTMAAWERGNQFLHSLIDGYLEGDGHYDAKNDRWRLGFTRNDYLAADLRTVAARLGASIRLKKTYATGFGERWPSYRGQWRWNPSGHHNTKPDSEVVAIARGRARRFYDIGVADDPHLFALASGVLTHNSKPNGLPESVTDRVRRSHESWFHFTREPRYFSGVDEIREPHETRMFTAPQDGQRRHTAAMEAAEGHHRYDERTNNPLGRLPGSVWRIPSEPLLIPDDTRKLMDLPDHFAAFPQEFPRRIILGWSPTGICVECGEGRRSVVDVDWSKVPHEMVEKAVRDVSTSASFRDEYGEWCKANNVTSRMLDEATDTDMGHHWSRHPTQPAIPTPNYWATLRAAGYAPEHLDHYVDANELVPSSGHMGGNVEDGLLTTHRTGVTLNSNEAPPKTVTGYACACPTFDAPTIAAVILDPFGGTGTVAGVARMLGRYGISNDLSKSYNKLAAWRIFQSDHFTKTEQRTWADRQGSLL